MKTDLISDLLDFLTKEKMKIELRRTSDSEFWLESPRKSLVARFIIDDKAREILYDIFSPAHDVHLKEETIRDVERIDSIAEDHKEWKLEENVENLWLVLDEIKLWAQKNKYEVREEKII